MTAHMIDDADIVMLSRMAGFEIDPAHLPGVMKNMRILLEQAALLMDPPLAAEIEPAVIYRA